MSRRDLGRRLDVYYKRLWRRWTFVLGRELLRRPLRDVSKRLVRLFLRNVLDGFLLLVFLSVFVLIFILILVVNKRTWGDLE